MNAETRSALLEDAFLRAPVKLGGFELRPLSAASAIILRRTKNPLVTQEEGAEEGVDIESPEGLLAAFAFIYVHAAPLSEVIKTHRDPAEFENAVLTFCAGFPLDLIQEALPAITGELATAAAAITEPERPESEETNDPNALGRPGSRTAHSQSPQKPKGRAAVGRK